MMMQIFVFLTVILCAWADDTATSTNKDGSFFCQYYSDHTMSCYNHYRNREANESLTPEAADRAFAIFGLGEPIKGSWTDEDGFFKADNSTAVGERKFVGTCMFDPNTGANCAHANPPCKQTPILKIECVDGGLFRVANFSGTPGGPIRPVLPVSSA
ncbi:uncharacterized protein LOC129580666 [Paramacrobiotus metropolitanus]|uniref:uncharacterized protein LOC129580666 n=1 Tax=Paramacrobiotus metropolitanus TaxID=2943436 RepID=UPI002445AA54|nr:uncharacterized protein LOC129580666 [Paramacrobiotus metropolitanus]